MTTTTKQPSALAPHAVPSPWRLLLLHTKYQMIEQFRIPMAIVGNVVFPAISFLFFVVPMAAVRDNADAAVGAAGQLALVSVLSVCLFTFGLGGAEDRGTPWDPYLRTLSAGVLPRLGARILTGLAFALVGVSVVGLFAVLLTAATFSLGQIGWGLAAMTVAGFPFLLMGIGLGHLLSVKAALPVVQMLFLPLAFAGGLFLPPELFPKWLESFSTLLPSRGGRDLVVGALGMDGPPQRVVVCLGVWTVALAVFAVWAYRRDEGRRFR